MRFPSVSLRSLVLLVTTAFSLASSGAEPIQLFRTVGQTRGTALKADSIEHYKSRMEGHTIEGRVRRVEKESFQALTKVSAGDPVTIPLADGSLANGLVHCVDGSAGFVRVGGALTARDGGTFTLIMNGSEVGGLVHLPKSGLVHRIDKAPSGEFVIREVLPNDVICSHMPRPGPTRVVPNERLAEPPPILSSRLQATAVLYLDFDGEIVTDPFWNGGQTINAPAANMDSTQVTAVWRRVAEDFAPFNVDITTDVARYDTAPEDMRMRCIITPNDAAAPGAGGVAYLYSFSGFGIAGLGSPCWVFIDDEVKFCADAVSHELGHTLGLQHDGRLSPPEEYYQGHDSWAPIMGVGYYRSTVQWSKGEYAGANNLEDDVAIIAGDFNGFGYVPDETGNTPAGAVPLQFDMANVNQAGIISQSTDSDFFVFSTTGGAFYLTEIGGGPSPNLDVILELQDSTGAILGTSNPVSSLTASLSRTLSAGDYFLKVSGTGVGAPPANGYSSYGSIGAYNIIGFIVGGSPTLVPVIAMPAAASGLRGIPFSFQILATGSPTSYAVAGTLPPGLTFQADSGLISGIPTKSGNFPLSMSATNSVGTGSRPITISINNGAVSIAEAVDAPAYAWISGGDDEWAGVLDISFDGQDSAGSAPILDGGTTYVETTVVGPGVASFHWRVDSEAGGDFLHFAVDGIERAQISGNIPWQLQSVTFSAGSHVLRWTYTKNASISQGLDRGWVDTFDVSFLPAPTITSAIAVIGEEGENFVYQIEADNSPIRFGVDGTLSDGLMLDPATGVISGIPSAPGTAVLTISATNDAGVTGTSPLTITVTPPILTLAESVDAEQFAWTTFGQQEWFPQTLVTSDGLHAAQSGDILDNQTSTLESIVIGPTALRFQWKVSSERDADILEVSVDGVVRAQISGDVDWTEQIIPIPSGTRKVRWQYRKDSTVSVGADAGWVDQVTFDSAPQFIGIRQAVGKVGIPFVFRVGAVNTPSRYEANTLPPGLVLESESGLITGTPTRNGVFPTSVSITNVSGTATRIFTITIEPGSAGSDTFLGATALEGAWVRLASNNAAATSEAGEPQHGAQSGGHSVWWSWTAPSTGAAVVSTAGSSFDTTLAVYRGDSLAGLSFVGQNDNAGRSDSSLVLFLALAGETYRIAVDGADGASGGIVLSITYDNSADLTALVRRVSDGVLTGYASGRITRSHEYTGKLLMEGSRYSFRGKLDPGTATIHHLKGQNAPSLTLTLSANPRTGTDSVAGVVEGNSAIHEFTFLRAMAPGDFVRDALGRYTAAVDAKINAPAFPGGIGFASFSLNRTGAVRMKGRLADGKPFSAGGPVDLKSRFALFAEPYRRGGSIGGYITFDQNAPTPSALGRLEWRKDQDLKSKLYPAGFSKFTEFRGARYVKPRGDAPVLNFRAGLVKFLGGDVNFSPNQQPVTISSTNKITPKGGLPQFSATIDTGHGLWKGSFRAGAGGLKLNFSGALLPSENLGVGVFVGNQQTGKITLESAVP